MIFSSWEDGLLSCYYDLTPSIQQSDRAVCGCGNSHYLSYVASFIIPHLKAIWWKDWWFMKLTVLSAARINTQLGPLCRLLSVSTGSFVGYYMNKSNIIGRACFCRHPHIFMNICNYIYLFTLPFELIPPPISHPMVWCKIALTTLLVWINHRPGLSLQNIKRIAQ